MKRILALLLASLLLTIANDTFGQNRKNLEKDALDRIIKEEQQKELGLTKLSTGEREKLATFLKGLMQFDSENSLEKVAIQKMEENGWEKVKVQGIKRLGNKEWLIVDVSPLSTWAIEPPLLSHFSSGYYWAKTSPLSGVNEMIDSSGTEYSFILADKKEL